MARQLAVETQALTKTFKGEPVAEQRTWADALIEAGKRLVRPPAQKTVVDGISLAVRHGEFFGIIGSNGAGKTTFLKLLTCLLYPDGGTGTVNGYDLLHQRAGVRRSVVTGKAGGWLTTHWQLTGRENLLFRARLCGLSGAEARRRADYVLDRLGIAHKADEHSWHWSAGERQKFGLAMTFIVRTPVVILDEPTSHLDPRTARLTREFVKEELNRRNGQTVVMSTHYLEEADLLCDRVAVFHTGRMLACDTPAALKRAYAPEQKLQLRVRGYTTEVGARVRERCGLAELLKQFEDVTLGQAKLWPQWTGAPPDPDELRRALEAEGVSVLSSKWVAPTMDDVYFKLTREKVQ